MGQDKALVELQGRPLAARTASVLRAAGCMPVTLVGRQPGLQDLGLPVVQEAEPGHHPLWGVAAALDASVSPLALVAPCDLIHLSIEAVQALLIIGEPCVAEGTHLHPLLALLPSALSAEARRLAQAGAPAHRLVSTLRRVRLPDSVLLDANRPVDLKAPPE
jgi:molybdopterin-guanine dinucleotide biosynthesis protein A